MEKEKCCHCSQRKKERSPEEYKKLIHRLNRIEGQIRGIKGMVENNAYCPDILIQSAAVNAAINAFNKELLANHIRTCVADDIRNEYGLLKSGGSDFHGATKPDISLGVGKGNLAIPTEIYKNLANCYHNFRL